MFLRLKIDIGTWEKEKYCFEGGIFWKKRI
jgi:hypothetical protein